MYTKIITTATDVHLPNKTGRSIKIHSTIVLYGVRCYNLPLSIRKHTKPNWSNRKCTVPFRVRFFRVVSWLDLAVLCTQTHINVRVKNNQNRISSHKLIPFHACALQSQNHFFIFESLDQPSSVQRHKHNDPRAVFFFFNKSFDRCTHKHINIGLICSVTFWTEAYTKSHSIVNINCSICDFLVRSILVREKVNGLDSLLIFFLFVFHCMFIVDFLFNALQIRVHQPKIIN